jgi:pimeloyl-ACP methyl ester carboxylesterase
MPKMHINDIQMHYDVYGDGEPLVLIAGLSAASWMWYKQVPVLSRHFKVITFDNRGAGQTDKPTSAYTIKQMAEDCAGLITALDISHANVFGISMGGFIAQELTINFPHLVNKLILGCTHYGGSGQILPTTAIQTALRRPQGSTMDEKLHSTLEFNLSVTTPRQQPGLVAEIFGLMRTNPMLPHAYVRQFRACQGHDTASRLIAVKNPTFIITGADDTLVPPENSQLLHQAIPRSKLAFIDNAGHLFFIEQPRQVNDLIINFLTA